MPQVVGQDKMIGCARECSDAREVGVESCSNPGRGWLVPQEASVAREVFVFQGPELEQLARLASVAPVPMGISSSSIDHICRAACVQSVLGETGAIRARILCLEDTLMPAVAVGNHAKLTARAIDRERIRRFYHEVLGCEITKRTESIDFFRFDADFFIAVIYDNAVLTEDEQCKSIWLELKADDPQALTKHIRDFGVRELETWEKDRLYFQAPGGQVFRVAGKRENLSRFES